MISEIYLFGGYAKIPSIDFRLDVWIDDPMLMLRIKSDLHFRIWKAFAEHNIGIPFPQRDLHLRSGIPWEKIGAKSKAEAIEREIKEEKPQLLSKPSGGR
jgi:small-conductance mechanosensitive channel